MWWWIPVIGCAVGAGTTSGLAPYFRRVFPADPGAIFRSVDGGYTVENSLEFGGQGASGQELISNLQARLAQPVQAADPSGAVEVTLGPDGLPSSFEVDEGWTRSLHATAIGGAVLGAFRAATVRRLALFAAVLEETDLPGEGDTEQPVPVQQFQAPSPSGGTFPPRSVDEFISEVLALTADIEALAEPAVVQATGSAASGMLTLTLGGDGNLSCEVDQAWASDKTGGELTTALNTALGVARRELTEAANASPAARATRLLDEALALQRGQLS